VLDSNAHIDGMVVWRRTLSHFDGKLFRLVGRLVSWSGRSHMADRRLVTGDRSAASASYLHSQEIGHHRHRLGVSIKQSPLASTIFDSLPC